MPRPGTKEVKWVLLGGFRSSNPPGPSIHVNRCAVDETACVGAQENRGVGDVFDFAHALDRNALDQRLLSCRICKPSTALCAVYCSWRDHIGGNTLGTVLERNAVRDGINARFCCARVDLFYPGTLIVRGTDKDNTAACTVRPWKQSQLYPE